MADETPTTEKRGARHSGADMAHLADIHGHATAIQAAALALGHAVPEMVQTIKAGDVPPDAQPAPIVGTIKAAGEWEIDILANPYGGPNNGKDADGEFFSPRTKFHEDKIPSPPIVHYHGYGDDKRPEGLPVFLGMPTKRWVDALGVWYRATLDKTVARAAEMMAAARKGTLRASTGVVLATHRVDQATGEILSWMNGEISIFDTATGKRPANSYAVARPALKALYAQAGLELPNFPDDTPPETDATGALGPVAVARTSHPSKTATEKKKMDEEIKNQIAEGIAAAMKAQSDAAAVEAERKQKEDERVAAAVKAQVDEVRAEYLKSGRLPLGGEAPAQTHFADTGKYDGLGVADQAFLTALTGSKLNGIKRQPSQSALKALAIKVAEDKGELGEEARQGLMKAGINPADVLNAQKANEVNYSTQALFGDDWAGVEYSRRLWPAVRAMTFVLQKLPEIIVPQGVESIVIPLESGDPTFYKVAQTTDENATTLTPNATVPSSKMGTLNKTLTVAKGGARTQYTGEMEEDSLIPWAAQLRMQLEKAAAEQLEHAVIDGDTETGGTANINTIGGTPGGTEFYLLFNGLRKSPLVTTTANSRSASGAFVDTDFMDTAFLMGAAGLLGLDPTKTDFIVDPNTSKRASYLASVKTRDVFANATIENGLLGGIWSYKVYTSWFMHYLSSTNPRKANTAGKVDLNTQANNTTGAILAVRWDQWLFGRKRNITIETVRIPRADVTEITALLRVGLLQRDTEGSAVTYNVGLS
jgi:hypothetical protein